MAFIKAKPGLDIVNGLAVVNNGNSTSSYDAAARTQHWASGDSLAVLQNINGRYRYHGGEGGSGNWEH